jgi:hypothetical protein
LWRCTRAEIASELTLYPRLLALKYA